MRAAVTRERTGPRDTGTRNRNRNEIIPEQEPFRAAINKKKRTGSRDTETRNRNTNEIIPKQEFNI